MQWEDRKLMLQRYEEKKKRYCDTNTGMYVGDMLVLFCKKTILNDLFEIMLPENFKDMEESMIKKKYAFEQRPLSIKTNEMGTVNLTFNLFEENALGSNIDSLFDGVELMLKTLYPSAIFGDKGNLKTDADFSSWMAFQSFSVNGTILNFLHLKHLDKKCVLSMYNCPYDCRESWNPIFTKVAESIHLADQEEGK